MNNFEEILTKIIMNLITLLLIIAGVLLVILLILAAISNFQIPEAQDQACENIGMEKTFFQGTTYCIDNKDQAHHTKFTCTGIFNIQCEARIISIGEYRTTTK